MRSKAPGQPRTIVDLAEFIDRDGAAVVVFDGVDSSERMRVDPSVN